MLRSSNRAWRALLASVLAVLVMAGLPSVASADVSIDPPPGKVVFDQPTITVCPASSLTVRWHPAPGEAASIYGYRLTVGTQPAVSLPASATSFKATGVWGNVDVSISALDGQGQLSAPQTVSYNVPIADCVPQVPVVTIGEVTKITIEVKWRLSYGDAAEVASWRIYRNGTLVGTVGGTTTTFVDTGLTADVAYKYSVSAVDDRGLEGARSAEVPATTRVEDPDTTPPSKPGNPQASFGGCGPRGIDVRWEPATDLESGLYGYELEYDGQVVTVGADATEYTFTDIGPEPATGDVSILAIDKAGNRSPWAVVPIDIIMVGGGCGGLDRLRYDVKGSTVLKTLAKGTLPLAGSLSAEVEPATGAFTGALALGNTSGRLVAAGFLPVTAKFGFAPSGAATGTVTSSSLTVSTKVRIKVLDVKLFGAIPLVAGNNCQAKQLTDLTLASTGTFSPSAGGTVAGTYKLSDLNGCGVLNGLVAPLTAGGGNTMTLALTPQA